MLALALGGFCLLLDQGYSYQEGLAGGGGGLLLRSHSHPPPPGPAPVAPKPLHVSEPSSHRLLFLWSWWPRAGALVPSSSPLVTS